MGWMMALGAVFGLAVSGCGGSGEPGEEISSPGLPRGMEFAAVPSGEFLMGSPETEPGRLGNEGPQSRVRIESFELMTTPVTRGMWREVMGEEWNASSPPSGTGDRHPMTGVNWGDTWAFIERLHELDPEHIYRLPSEAEWEYACRAGTETAFFWGNDPSPETADPYCWHWGNSEGTSQPVALKQGNPWGFHDMSGNVKEWCHDTWSDDHREAPEDGAPRESPGNPFRVVRGGSWRHDLERCRSAYRFAYAGHLSAMTIGFRVARVPAGP